MSADTLLQGLTQVLFVAVFLVVAVTALRYPRRATIDTALLFGVLSLLVAEGWAVTAWGRTPSPALTTVASVLIMVLPYLLLRLVNDFAGMPRLVRRAAEVGLAAMVASLVVVAGHTLPLWLTLLLVAYFVGLMLYGAVVVV